MSVRCSEAGGSKRARDWVSSQANGWPLCQRKYCTARQDLLALITFTHQFKHYSLSRRFLVRTDRAVWPGWWGWRILRDTWHGGWKNWHKVICRVCTKKGKQLANADALSRLPDSMTRCDCYRAGMTVRSLPCGGCRHCIRAHQEWGRFEDGVPDSSPRIGKC